MLTLDDLAGGPDLRQSVKESILSKWNTYPPNLQHQYQLELDRLDRLLVAEIGTYPGLNALVPSEILDSPSVVLRY